MRVYLDTMIWIYALEGHAQFGPASQAMLRTLRSNGDTLLTSHFLLAELLVAPVKKGDTFTAVSYRRMLTSASVEVVPFNAETAVHFALLRAGTRVKPADAIHLALAASAGADVFVTGDQKLIGMTVAGVGRIVDVSQSI